MSTARSAPAVVVVGSCNMDLITYVDRLPKLGETIHGKAFEQGCGGKGANQAVMAAKLGSSVLFITRVGTDSFGKVFHENFKACGMLEDGVLDTPGSTGVAAISVDSDGNNSIAIVGGANNLLLPAEVESFRGAIAKAKVMVCQLEVRLDTTLTALRVAKSEGVTTIFNPAPAPPSLDPEFYTLSDIFCVNETEAETLSGVKVVGTEGAAEASRVFMSRGCKAVIITLGGDGVAICSGAYGLSAEEVTLLPAPKVTVVDTVGAGDAFVGSLAVFLACGTVPLVEACRRAILIASDSVQRKGSQISYGTRASLPAELFEGVPC